MLGGWSAVSRTEAEALSPVLACTVHPYSLSSAAVSVTNTYVEERRQAAVQQPPSNLFPAQPHLTGAFTEAFQQLYDGSLTSCLKYSALYSHLASSLPRSLMRRDPLLRVVWTLSCQSTRSSG